MEVKARVKDGGCGGRALVSGSAGSAPAWLRAACQARMQRPAASWGACSGSPGDGIEASGRLIKIHHLNRGGRQESRGAVY